MTRFDANSGAIAGFCRLWGVSRLWLFGSLATGAATSGGDADVLVEFLPQSQTSTWDWPLMQDELRAVYGREVGLLSTGVLRNPYRRRAILGSRRLLYVA